MFILFYKFLFFFNDLLEIQRKSFYLFLNFQLGEELFKIQPLVNSRKLPRRRNINFNFSNIKTEKKDKTQDNLFPTALYFLYENYKFINPSLNIEESILFSKTYCCRFYMPIQMIDSITNFFEIQWIFLGTLPLLTKRGHFIINGTPRVVLNQIVRSPGIYFHQEKSNEYDNSRCFYAEIVSKQGPWLRLEIDKKKKIWINFRGITRLSLPHFFINFHRKFIDHQFFLWEKKKTLNLDGILINNFFRKENSDILKKEFKFQTLYTYNYSKDYLGKISIDFYKMAKKFKNNLKYFTIFFIPLKTPIIYDKKFINNFEKANEKIRLYNVYKKFNHFEYNPTNILASSAKNTYLGTNGRKRLNQRLGLSLKTLNLTPIDFLAISNILFQLTQNTNNINIVSTNLITTSLDDIDDLKNRQIKTIGELLQNQLARGIQRFNKTFENIFKKDVKRFLKSPKIESSLTVLNIFKIEQQKRNVGWMRSKTKPFKKIRQKYKDISSESIRARMNDIRSFKKRSFTKRNSYLIRLQKLNYFKIYILKFKRNFLWNELFVKNLINSPKVFGKKTRFLKANPASTLKKYKTGIVKNSLINPLQKKTKPIAAFLNTQAINSAFKEFFHSHQLSQYLDQSNPLAELTHKRRLSCLGSGGVNRDNAGMEIRGIHVSHYGRICPIETPEGKNAGLVNSLTTAVNINKKGYLETPFREVFKQHAQNQKKLMFFSSENQEIQKVFFSQKLPKAKNVAMGVLNLKTGNFEKCNSFGIQLIAFNPQQFIAIAATCVPFIEHDDANRALMGSNMQRQALPLMQLEQPLVTTYNAFRILSDLKDISTSYNSGIVLYASQQKISFYTIKAHSLISKK